MLVQSRIGNRGHGILILTSLGLVAVTAGNMLTLLLAWAALDVIELVILLGQMLQSKSRERIILAFSARMAGIGTVLLAGIIPWSQGPSLSFECHFPIRQAFIYSWQRVYAWEFFPFIFHLLRSSNKAWPRDCFTPDSCCLKLYSIGAGSQRWCDRNVTPYLLGLTILAGMYAAAKLVDCQR